MFPERGESIERQEYELEVREEPILEHLLHVEQKSLSILEQILRVNERNEQLLITLVADLAPEPETLSRFSAVQFTGDPPMADNILNINIGQTSTASPVTFLSDGVTPSGATYSAASYAFSDASATVVLNPDGVTALVTGVADSGGVAVSGSVAFTALDTDGAISTWTQSFTITTGTGVPPPPTQLSQSSAVQFSTPV